MLVGDASDAKRHDKFDKSHLTQSTATPSALLQDRLSYAQRTFMEGRASLLPGREALRLAGAAAFPPRMDLEHPARPPHRIMPRETRRTARIISVSRTTWYMNVIPTYRPGAVPAAGRTLEPAAGLPTALAASSAPEIGDPGMEPSTLCWADAAGSKPAATPTARLSTRVWKREGRDDTSAAGSAHSEFAL